MFLFCFTRCALLVLLDTSIVMSINFGTAKPNGSDYDNLDGNNYVINQIRSFCFVIVMNNRRVL